MAAAYWQGQADMARETYLDHAFDANSIPQGRLLFFSGKHGNFDPLPLRDLHPPPKLPQVAPPG